MPNAGLCSCWGGRVLPLLLVYVCYLLLGATIFQLLERQAEAQSRYHFQLEKLRFLENYTCLDQWALEQFVQVKGSDVGWGWRGLGRLVEWGFLCLPQTPPNLIQSWRLSSGLRGQLLPSQVLQVLGLALFLTLGTLVILIFPPMVFSHVEGWSFSEGFYFAFITLSTIGFGDYVVGENKTVTLSQEPFQTPPGKPESQQIPGSFQKVRSMDVWPLSGIHYPDLAFPLPDCNIPDQKERFRPLHPEAWKLWPLPLPPSNSKRAPTWLGSSA
uniref:Potassium two pore domain channel subfamily K member 16 n=1 Tax=Cercocebus atys TaxID=9531 RepID=A0A2K5NZ31_CERAT